MRTRSDPEASPSAGTLHQAVIKAMVRERLTELDDPELNRRLRDGYEEWTQLQDTLARAGMLPDERVVERLLDFLENRYPSVEAARIEGVIRSRLAERTRSRPDRGQGLGL